MTISRKQWLRYAGATAAGSVAGVYVRGWLEGDPGAAANARPNAGWAIPPAPPGWQAPPRGLEGVESFAQCGEDLAVAFALGYLQTGSRLTYLDVGAHDPVRFSNTYYFYRKGHRGVLVEPNRTLCGRLRQRRPEDAVLEAGIGPGGKATADYYVMNRDGLNTFSKEEAERHVRVGGGSVAIREVIPTSLLDINEVMAGHFQGAPTFLSIDTEGLDLAILKSIDYARFRPPVICAETLMPDSRKLRAEIPEFLAARGYTPRGGSLVNTIFVDANLLT